LNIARSKVLKMLLKIPLIMAMKMLRLKDREIKGSQSDEVAGFPINQSPVSLHHMSRVAEGEAGMENSRCYWKSKMGLCQDTAAQTGLLSDWWR
jgi:hypothetical protein